MPDAAFGAVLRSIWNEIRDNIASHSVKNNDGSVRFKVGDYVRLRIFKPKKEISSKFHIQEGTALGNQQKRRQGLHRVQWYLSHQSSQCRKAGRT